VHRPRQPWEQRVPRAPPRLARHLTVTSSPARTRRPHRATAPVTMLGHDETSQKNPVDTPQRERTDGGDVAEAVVVVASEDPGLAEVDEVADLLQARQPQFIINWCIIGRLERHGREPVKEFMWHDEELRASGGLLVHLYRPPTTLFRV
jgi:hypothetical protein